MSAPLCQERGVALLHAGRGLPAGAPRATAACLTIVTLLLPPLGYLASCALVHLVTRSLSANLAVLSYEKSRTGCCWPLLAWRSPKIEELSFLMKHKPVTMVKNHRTEKNLT